MITRLREHVARVDLLPVRAPRRDWTETFLADGDLVVRHPDHDHPRDGARSGGEDPHPRASLLR